MRGEDTYARMYASLCLNGHPAIQAKYTYSTLLLALLFGSVVYASATHPHLQHRDIGNFMPPVLKSFMRPFWFWVCYTPPPRPPHI